MRSFDEQSPREDDCSSDANLPCFDKALHTRNWCIAGLSLCYVLSIVCICCGSVGYNWNWDPEHFSDVNPVIFTAAITGIYRELILFAFNLLVTISTECIGYIHATSLRWALYQENRLRCNSNLRLFTSSRLAMPNRCFANAIWILMITVSYSCASQLFVSSVDETISYQASESDPNVIVELTGINCLSIIVFGCCLLVLSLLATWSLLPGYNSHIKTWNSDALNTALATQHMRHQQTPLYSPANAKMHQNPMTHSSRNILYMLAFLWFLVPVLCVASAATWALTARDNNRDLSFLSDETMTRKTHTNWPLRLWATYNSGYYSFSSQIIINISFITALQLIYAIALHVAELFVNLHRDEESWRRAGVLNTKAGAMISKDSSIAAATAWPTVFLFATKPVSHWIFGLRFPVDLKQGIKYHPLPLFVLTAIAVLLASFATYLALRRPKGPQPPAYGNLDQPINMIDD